MVFDSQKARDRAISTLNLTIDALNMANGVSTITPAKAVFGTVAILLTMIRVRGILVSDDIVPITLYLGCHG